jgi:hypothetical protein
MAIATFTASALKEEPSVAARNFSKRASGERQLRRHLRRGETCSHGALVTAASAPRGALPLIPAARLPMRIFSMKQQEKVTSLKCHRYPVPLIKLSCKACRRAVWPHPLETASTLPRAHDGQSRELVPAGKLYRAARHRHVAAPQAEVRLVVRRASGRRGGK